MDRKATTATTTTATTAAAAAATTTTATTATATTASTATHFGAAGHHAASGTDASVIQFTSSGNDNYQFGTIRLQTYRSGASANDVVPARSTTATTASATAAAAATATTAVTTTKFIRR